MIHMNQLQNVLHLHPIVMMTWVVAPDTTDFTTATSTSPRVDTRVATEHLLKLKQRPGVTESLLKEVVAMNQALVRGSI